MLQKRGRYKIVQKRNLGVIGKRVLTRGIRANPPPVTHSQGSVIVRKETY